jgi:proline dehydrogenase
MSTNGTPAAPITAIYRAGMRVLTPVYERAGCAYLTGTERSSALTLAERLLAEGSPVTLGYWPRKDETVARVTEEEQATIEALGDLGQGDKTAVSLKVARLGFDANVVRQLARQAVQRQIGLVFDAHSPAEADQTLELAKIARSKGASTGIVLPARWKRSAGDALTASEYGLWVRVVKGQWPDDAPGSTVSSEAALRTSFIALVNRLLGLGVRTAIATHDVVLLEQALTRIAAASAHSEVELLLGLPVRRPLETAQRAGAATRFYVSFGYPGLPYPFRAILRRPRLAWLLTQGIVLGSRNQDIQRRAALGSPE